MPRPMPLGNAQENGTPGLKAALLRHSKRGPGRAALPRDCRGHCLAVQDLKTLENLSSEMEVCLPKWNERGNQNLSTFAQNARRTGQLRGWSLEKTGPVPNATKPGWLARLSSCGTGSSVLFRSAKQNVKKSARSVDGFTRAQSLKARVNLASQRGSCSSTVIFTIVLRGGSSKHLKVSESQGVCKPQVRGVP